MRVVGADGAGVKAGGGTSLGIGSRTGLALLGIVTDKRCSLSSASLLSACLVWSSRNRNVALLRSVA